MTKATQGPILGPKVGSGSPMLTVPIASFHLQNALCFTECGSLDAAISSTSFALTVIQRKVPCALVSKWDEPMSREEFIAEASNRLRMSAECVDAGNFFVSAREAIFALQILRHIAADTVRN
jgi:hypothetical protein